jgi:regulator of sigma E protease
MRRELVKTEGEAAVSSYFHFKPLHQRAIIVAAGPLANFALAIAIFAAVLMVQGEAIQVPKVGSVERGSPAEAAGFRAGDTILRIEGRAIDSFDDIAPIEILSSGTPLTFDIEREGQPLTLIATPVRGEVTDVVGRTHQLGYLGLGPPAQPPKIGSVEKGSPAEAAGFRIGDIVRRIDGRAVDSFDDIVRAVMPASGTLLTFDIERDGQPLTLAATPAPGQAKDAAGKIHQVGRLGMGSARAEVQIKRYNPVEAVAKGTENAYGVIKTTLTYVGRMIGGRENADQLSGPLGMAHMSGDIAKTVAERSPDMRAFVTTSVLMMLMLIANISVGIGFMNLLPVPVLDGGHLVFYAYEAVARRPLAAKVQAVGYRVGLALVLSLMLFATWNDLQRLNVFKSIGGLFS